ncbi:MAG: arginine--tRNA ligase [Phycisphaerae bacterium]|nr:arginine--tRNA ligase [Phycisphaerae bacterium]
MPEPASFDPVAVLAERFRAAIARAFPEAADADPMITASRQANLGDFQSNAAMPLAKRLGKKPREIAEAIVRNADLGDVAEPLTKDSIAGPGFINLRLRADTLGALLSRLDSPDLGLPPVEHPQTVVVDLMGVNLAKQMHVGHLRSPIIGDALARTLERLGHRVIRQNHVGDWGLPIAMVTARLRRLAAAGTIDLSRITLDDLDRAYAAAQAECKRDLEGLAAARRFGQGPKALAELEEQVMGAEAAFAEARQTLVKLQAHDPETFAVWQRIADVTMQVCLATCERLHVNVTAEHSAGESSYAAELAPMVADLVSRGIAEESEGALVVRLEDPAYGGIKEPCIVRKTDGGFLYATTDVAAIRRRVQKLGADRLIYVIDARQNLHLRQVYGASLRAGYAINPRSGKPAEFQHAAFGMILGDDGRPFKTRTGDNVKLADLLEETVERAERAVAQRAGEREIPASERRAIAEAVGIAAIKHADLCNDRIKDYVFSFDRMLAFEGNTGPYLLYALVRIRSIFRNADAASQAAAPAATLALREAGEKSLGLALLRYPAVVRSVGESLEPHRLVQYLFDLASAFSAFYDACPVLKAETEALRQSRLRLCHLTARVLADGLGILGIPTLERM